MDNFENFEQNLHTLVIVLLADICVMRENHAAWTA